MPYDAAKDPFWPTPDKGHTVAQITPSDTTDLSTYPRDVIALTNGNVACLPLKNADGATVTIAVVSGQKLPFRVRRILTTGTTATVASML